MPRGGAERAGDKWQRKLRAARIEAALTNTATAFMIGATGIVAVACFVGEFRGLLNSGTWELVLALGAGITLSKAVFDFRDRSNESDLWRTILIQEFGDEMRNDAETARLARLAIEFRARLSEAEASTHRTHARKVTALMPRVDDWLDQIVALARKVASLRSEARFQAVLATRSKERLSQISAQARAASDLPQEGQLLETGRSLSAQVNAFDGFNRYVDDAYLRLEHAVGAFTAACSKLVLELSRDDEDATAEAGMERGKIAVQIGQEMAETRRIFAAIGQLQAPDFNVVSEHHEKPETARPS